MAVKQRSVTLYHCERCGHEWIPRDALADEQELATICPKCKSPYWNKPRKVSTGAAKKTKKRRR